MINKMNLNDLVIDLCMIFHQQDKERDYLIRNDALETEDLIDFHSSCIDEKVINAAVPDIIEKPSIEKTKINYIKEAINGLKDFVVPTYKKLLNIVKKAYTKTREFFNLNLGPKRQGLFDNPVKKEYVKQMIWYGILPANQELRKLWATYVVL
jgi:hypothetical protein